MKQDYTDITIILDRSGSMASIQSDTEGGFNTFLKSQKKLPGKCNISLYQFDDKYETVYENLDVKIAPKLVLNPRGNTALLDAIGKTIDNMGNRFRNLPESERPSKIIVTIITDGAENSSKEFSRDKIFEMINHQKDKYSWEFVFLGANQDAIATATSYGINASNTLTYAANSVGTKSLYNSLGDNLTRYRSSVSCDCSFTTDDRLKQEEELNKV